MIRPYGMPRDFPPSWERHLEGFLLASCRRFPRSTPRPRPRSCHVYAGHHAARKQVPAALLPGAGNSPGFDVILNVSTRHPWFAGAHLRGPHLTPLGCLFLNAHHQSFCLQQLEVVCSLPLQAGCEGPAFILRIVTRSYPALVAQFPDVISASLSQDAWAMIPAGRQVHRPVSSPTSSAFPTSLR